MFAFLDAAAIATTVARAVRRRVGEASLDSRTGPTGAREVVIVLVPVLLKPPHHFQMALPLPPTAISPRHESVPPAGRAFNLILCTIDGPGPRLVPPNAPRKTSCKTSDGSSRAASNQQVLPRRLIVGVVFQDKEVRRAGREMYLHGRSHRAHWVVRRSPKSPARARVGAARRARALNLSAPDRNTWVRGLHQVVNRSPPRASMTSQCCKPRCWAVNTFVCYSLG
jgi:hypothetical protein